MTTFILVRHGYTDWIEKEILHGISDRPLSEFGLEQADATAKFLHNTKIDRMYSSPLIRAMQTAEKIGETTGAKPEPVADLREENYGWLEGKRDWWPTVKDRKSLIPFYIFTRVSISTLTGEPFWQFRQRVVNAWRKIKEENSSGTIAIVAHSGVLRTILTHEFGGTRFDTEKYSLTACSVSRIEVNGNSPHIISLNENSHLPGDNHL
ncbi:MAG: histidine phosphatase family protein [Pelolinea sp.]|nr:histidine phosphatase family protein [Pelolinea sp.]